MTGPGHGTESVPTAALGLSGERSVSPPSPRRRIRRGWRILLLIVALLLIAVGITSFIGVPYYAIVPGSTLDVGPLIGLDGHGRDHPGKILLVDVDLVSLNALNFLFYRLNPSADIVGSHALTGTATAAQYRAQGVVDMEQARQAATVVALHTLGYDVRAVPSGVVVYQPVASTPAAKVLNVGDVINAVDNKPTPTPSALLEAVRAKEPGTPVTLTVRPADNGPVRRTTIHLGHSIGAGATGRCVVVVAAPARGPACLGVVLEPQFTTAGAPFSPRLDSEGIVGPSAGLAYTLGLIDKLDPASLTAGRTIAATGKMAIDGTVGDVGGVAQKAVAVRRSGARVFLVPTVEVKTARAHAGPTVQVYGVANIDQAIAVLERLGGRIVTPKVAS